MDLRIVPATDAHSAGVITLMAAIFAEYDGVQFHLDEMPELEGIATSFAAMGGRFWCALRGERVVGSVGYSPATTGDGFELRKLYVASDERRAGLASRLCDLVEGAADAEGKAFVELWSDVKFTTAHAFYERRGYVRGPATRRLHDRSDTVEYYFRKALLEV